jgi:hypothetical protein
VFVPQNTNGNSQIFEFATEEGLLNRMYEDLVIKCVKKTLMFFFSFSNFTFFIFVYFNISSLHILVIY